jgi:hypothetical protein
MQFQQQLQQRIDELELGLVTGSLLAGHRPLAFVARQLLHMVAPLVELLGFSLSHAGISSEVNHVPPRNDSETVRQ